MISNISRPNIIVFFLDIFLFVSVKIINIFNRLENMGEFFNTSQKICG